MKDDFDSIWTLILINAKAIASFRKLRVSYPSGIGVGYIQFKQCQQIPLRLFEALTGLLVLVLE